MRWIPVIFNTIGLQTFCVGHGSFNVHNNLCACCCAHKKQDRPLRVCTSVDLKTTTTAYTHTHTHTHTHTQKRSFTLSRPGVETTVAVFIESSAQRAFHLANALVRLAICSYKKKKIKKKLKKRRERTEEKRKKATWGRKRSRKEVNKTRARAHSVIDRSIFCSFPGS